MNLESLGTGGMRGEGGGNGLWMGTEVSEAGLLRLELFSWSDAANLPELQPEAKACGEVKGSGPIVLERSRVHLVMLVAPRPEPYLFRVVPRSSRQGLGEVEIRSSFVPGRSPQGLVARGGEDEEEIEIEADPVTLSGPAVGNTIPELLGELCRVDADDHGDSFTCATWLGGAGEIAGELTAGDVDVFLVVLGTAAGSRGWTVEVETSGGVDTTGTLFDGRGRRVGWDDDGGVGRNFRLVRTLPPGMYFVRVQAYHGDAGSYRVHWGAESSAP